MKHRKILLLSLFLSSTIVNADEVIFEKNIPSKADVISALKPKDLNESAATDYEGDVPGCIATKKCRMLPSSLLGTDEPKSITKTNNLKIAPSINNKQKLQGEQALSMQVIFDYNSAELSDASKKQLNPIGEALASNELKNLNFEVEGHTDAIGSDAYNDNLSAERAASVKKYLVEKFGVSAKQISTFGKGKLGLLDPTHPDSEVNRRVRIVALK